MSESIEKLLDRYSVEERTATQICTFGELVDDFTQERQASGLYSPDTLRSEFYKAGVLKQYLYDAQVKELTSLVIKVVLRALQEDRGLSQSSMRGYYTLMRSILKHGCSKGVISYNPCLEIKPPKPVEGKRNSLTEYQLRKLCSALIRYITERTEELIAKEIRFRKSHKTKKRRRGHIMGFACISYAYMQLTIAMTGIRMSECRGLRWRDALFFEKKLSIDHSLSCLNTIRDTKNRQHRSLCIRDNLITALNIWGELSATLLATINVNVDENSFIFCNGAGGPVQSRAFIRWWDETRDSLGFQGWKTHELRHTQASFLVREGCDLETVRDRMGWTNLQMVNVYAHRIDNESERAAAIKLDSMLSA